MSQKPLEEINAFHSNFNTLLSLIAPLDRTILEKLLHAPDLASLRPIINSTYNALLHSLKHENLQIRRSARAYIICKLIKNKSYGAADRCMKLLTLSKSDQCEFLEIMRDWHLLDEEDFTLLCQAIAELPITSLSYRIRFAPAQRVVKFLISVKELFSSTTTDDNDIKTIDFSDLGPLARKRLPKLIASLRVLVSLSLQVKFFNDSDQNCDTLCREIISSHQNSLN